MDTQKEPTNIGGRSDNERTVEQVLWLNGAWSFIVTSAITLPFCLQRGLSASEFFSIQSMFLLFLAAADVPAGLLSDIFDRKLVLLGACVVRGVGGTVLLISYDYYTFLLSFLLIAAGNSLFSGTDIAVLYEANEASRKPRTNVDLLGARYMFIQSSLSVSMVIGSAIGYFSIELAFIINCLGAWTPLILAYQVKTTGYATRKSNVQKRTNILAALHGLKAKSPELLVVLLIVCAYSAAPYPAFYLYQALWESEGLPLFLFGVIGCAYGLTGALMARTASKIHQKIGYSGVLVLIITGPVAAFVATGSGVLGLAVLGGACIEVSRGLAQSVVMAAFNEGLAGQVRATVNSVASLGTRLSAAAMNAALSMILGQSSVSDVLFYFASGFYVVVGICTLTLLACYKPSSLANARRNGPEN
ncbi:MFS transporter [Agrobacterium radiobacter]|uniref:MFS transporter n=1 Tax=Agrobacterium radiobacter TaxID=362 RepID=UPI003F87A7DB